MTESFEKGPEGIPTKEEVLAVISRYAEGAPIVRELSDGRGLYLLEVEIKGKEPGETIQHVYIREGEFPDGNASLETSIHEVTFQDGVAIGGSSVAVYSPETREWVDVK